MRYHAEPATLPRTASHPCRSCTRALMLLTCMCGTPTHTRYLAMLPLRVNPETLNTGRRRRAASAKTRYPIGSKCSRRRRCPLRYPCYPSTITTPAAGESNSRRGHWTGGDAATGRRHGPARCGRARSNTTDPVATESSNQQQTSH